MTININYLGHSAFTFNYKDYSIVIDPFLTGNPQSSIKAADLDVQDILLTHAHSDHIGDAIDISAKKGVKITAIYELANYCAKKGAESQGVNFGKVPFNWGCAYWLPALHSNSTPDGEYGGEAASIMLNIDNKTIFHAGDTGLHYNFKMIGEYYKPEISLLPIGGYYTMDADEAVQAAVWLNSKIIIPMHFNTFGAIKADVEEFKSQIKKKTKSECVILKPGEIFKF